jgi:hypothetical protein
MLVPDWIHQTTKRIVLFRQHMSDLQNMEKMSYVNSNRLNIEFQVDEEVLLGCHLLKVLFFLSE